MSKVSYKDLFVRKSILNEISDRVDNHQQSVNIVGLKGSGKSFLLNHVLENGLDVSDKASYQYIFVDGKKYSIDSDNSSAFWHDIFEQAKYKLNNLEANTDEDPYQNFLNIIASQSRKIVLLVDNIDAYLSAIDINDYRKIINISDLGLRRNIVFLATSMDHPNKAIEDNHRIRLNESPFFNFFVDYLQPFTIEETKLITEKIGFSDQESLFLYEVTGGYPTLVMLTMEKMLLLQQKNGDHLRSRDFSEVENSLLIDDQAIWLCKAIYSDMKVSQKKILEPVVLDRDTSALTSVPTAVKLIDHQGLLRLENGRLLIFSQLFSQIIKSELINSSIVDESTANIAEEPFTLGKYNAPNVSNLFYSEEKREIEINGNTIKLSNLENRLFSYLYSKRNQICSVDELHRNVWPSNRSLKVVERGINRLRAKVEMDASTPQWIINIKGKGYKLLL